MSLKIFNNSRFLPVQMKLLVLFLKIDFTWYGLGCLKFNALWGKCSFPRAPPPPPAPPYLNRTVMKCQSGSRFFGWSLRCWGDWLRIREPVSGCGVLWAELLHWRLKGVCAAYRTTFLEIACVSKKVSSSFLLYNILAWFNILNVFYFFTQIVG